MGHPLLESVEHPALASVMHPKPASIELTTPVPSVSIQCWHPNVPNVGTQRLHSQSTQYLHSRSTQCQHPWSTQRWHPHAPNASTRCLNYLRSVPKEHLTSALMGGPMSAPVRSTNAGIHVHPVPPLVGTQPEHTLGPQQAEPTGRPHNQHPRTARPGASPSPRPISTLRSPHLCVSWPAGQSAQQHPSQSAPCRGSLGVGWWRGRSPIARWDAE